MKFLFASTAVLLIPTHLTKREDLGIIAMVVAKLLT